MREGERNLVDKLRPRDSFQQKLSKHNSSKGQRLSGQNSLVINLECECCFCLLIKPTKSANFFFSLSLRVKLQKQILFKEFF